jgi:hypothetical protein
MITSTRCFIFVLWNMQILAAIKVNLAPIERRNSMVQLCSLKDKGDNLKISTKSSALGSAVVSVSDSSDA